MEKVRNKIRQWLGLPLFEDYVSSRLEGLAKDTRWLCKDGVYKYNADGTLEKLDT